MLFPFYKNSNLCLFEIEIQVVSATDTAYAQL